MRAQLLVHAYLCAGAFMISYACISKCSQAALNMTCPVCRMALMDELSQNDLESENLGQNSSQPAGSIESTHPRPFLLAYDLVIKQKIAELLAQKQAMEANERAAEAAVLLDFLLRLREKKQAALERLNAELSQIDSDIQHARMRVSATRPRANSEISNSVPSLHDSLEPPAKRALFGAPSTSPQVESDRYTKLHSYFGDLEHIYFKEHLLDCDAEDKLDCFGKKLSQVTAENSFKELGSFAMLDSLSNCNIISSLEFDRTGTMFAAAGVSKRIKVFNYDQLLSACQSRGNPFSVQDIRTPSKISYLAWNPYIQQQLASVDYQGIVNIYDSTTGQVTNQYEEHDSRAWSIAYSSVDPTRLVSASDDHRVKLWSLKSRSSICTIDGRANICSALFSPVSSYTIAFGSADHKSYIYDLRNPTKMLMILEGHKKAVSYVRYLSEHELVTASTDRSLRLWNLKGDQPECVRVYSGHVNEKNFVGLSMNGDLMATGSETNTVHVYHSHLSSPIAEYKFTHHCPRTGVELGHDDSAFIGSLAWKPASNRMVAANSLGMVKLLELSS